jgi:hypothetical protein
MLALYNILLNDTYCNTIMEVMWISTNGTNIYLASIRFGTLQYLCNTLYRSQRIPTVLGIILPCYVNTAMLESVSDNCNMLIQSSRPQEALLRW